MREDVEWYLRRICYYDGLLSKPKREEPKRFRIYGPIEGYVGVRGVKFMRDFWIDGLVEFVEKDTKRKIKSKKDKNKKE